MLSQSGVITSKDPSFSVVNKKWNDSKSKDTTITGCVKDKVIFIVDSTQLLGGDPDRLYDVAKDQIVRNGSTIFVMDAHGPQLGNFKMFVDWFKRDNIDISCISHTKSKAISGEGKARTAALVLGEMFQSGRIFIHQSLRTLIDQIERVNKGYDFLDVLIQIAILNLEAIESRGNHNHTKKIDYDEFVPEEIEYVDSVSGY
jgi:hypothetical protein